MHCVTVPGYRVSDIQTARVLFLQSSDECQGRLTQHGRLTKVTFDRNVGLL